MHKGKTEFDPQAKEQLFEAITMLNDFLKGKKWVAGNDLTISDFSIVGTLSTIIVSTCAITYSEFVPIKV